MATASNRLDRAARASAKAQGCLDKDPGFRPVRRRLPRCMTSASKSCTATGKIFFASLGTTRKRWLGTCRKRSRDRAGACRRRSRRTPRQCEFALLAEAMATPKKLWKKGRGKLGALDPLLGAWETRADSPQGPIRCVRTFSSILGGSYVRLAARWELPGSVYEEHSVYGAPAGAPLGFWSFTSDGQALRGDGRGLHRSASRGGGLRGADAGGARAPGLLARGGRRDRLRGRVAEPKGWSRFVHHHYTPLAAGG